MRLTFWRPESERKALLNDLKARDLLVDQLARELAAEKATRASLQAEMVMLADEHRVRVEREQKEKDAEAAMSIARCPGCDGTHLSRLATECESRFDGAHERAVATGGLYLCNDCGARFYGRKDGAHKVNPREPAVEAPSVPDPNARPAKPPGSLPRIPVRFPQSKA
jgi:hypothetical protein